MSELLDIPMHLRWGINSPAVKALRDAITGGERRSLRDWSRQLGLSYSRISSLKGPFDLHAAFINGRAEMRDGSCTVKVRRGHKFRVDSRVINIPMGAIQAAGFDTL